VSRRAWQIFAVIAVVAFLATLVAAFSVVYWSEGYRFTRQYDKLHIGLSREAVVALLGREPDVECRFGSASVLYFNRRSLVDSETPENVSTHPVTRDEIPYLYAHAQLLLDSKNRLIAYTLMGETTTVVTAVGTFAGSRLIDIDDSAWAQLIAQH
jgi:hypothetical protein